MVYSAISLSLQYAIMQQKIMVRTLVTFCFLFSC